MARILKLVPELPRLRLSSIDAAEIDPDLMACLANEPRLMPYLHLSLQAGDDMILKRMKRRHLRADALKLVADVRAVRPDTAFGADLIAGFPTETEEMFENTLSLVEAAGLSFLHVFPYSPRPGTPAARMPAVKGAVVKARAARLRAAGDAALSRHLQRQMGRTLMGLVERNGVARAEDFTEIAFTGPAEIGEIVAMRVTGHDGRRVLAQAVVLQAAEDPAPRREASYRPGGSSNGRIAAISWLSRVKRTFSPTVRPLSIASLLSMKGWVPAGQFMTSTGS